MQVSSIRSTYPSQCSLLVAITSTISTSNFDLNTCVLFVLSCHTSDYPQTPHDEAWSYFDNGWNPCLRAIQQSGEDHTLEQAHPCHCLHPQSNVWDALLMCMIISLSRVQSYTMVLPKYLNSSTTTADSLSSFKTSETPYGHEWSHLLPCHLHTLGPEWKSCLLFSSCSPRAHHQDYTASCHQSTGAAQMSHRYHCIKGETKEGGCRYVSLSHTSKLLGNSAIHPNQGQRNQSNWTSFYQTTFCSK